MDHVSQDKKRSRVAVESSMSTSVTWVGGNVCFDEKVLDSLSFSFIILTGAKGGSEEIVTSRATDDGARSLCRSSGVDLALFAIALPKPC